MRGARFIQVQLLKSGSQFCFLGVELHHARVFVCPLQNLDTDQMLDAFSPLRLRRANPFKYKSAHATGTTDTQR
jgi:hypothetical protein